MLPVRRETGELFCMDFTYNILLRIFYVKPESRVNMYHIHYVLYKSVSKCYGNSK